MCKAKPTKKTRATSRYTSGEEAQTKNGIGNKFRGSSDKGPRQETPTRPSVKPGWPPLSWCGCHTTVQKFPLPLAVSFLGWPFAGSLAIQRHQSLGCFADVSNNRALGLAESPECDEGENAMSAAVRVTVTLPSRIMIRPAFPAGVCGRVRTA